MEQLILHLFGDYISQSDWMANNKTKHWWPALLHAVFYSLPFLLIGSWPAVGVIFGTHYLIDRFRLARFVVYVKNVVLHPASTFPVIPCSDDEWKEWFVAYEWRNCGATGYPSERPAWLAVWLLIAADNTLHLILNWVALRWL